MSKRLTITDFVSRSNYVHNGRYDYSNTTYSGINDKLTIRCPIHGEFNQVAYNHTRGSGCPSCGLDSMIRTHRVVTTSDFIVKAIAKYGSEYDYSLVDYINNYTPVVMVCKVHGRFLQTPDRHLNDSCGCKKCKATHIKDTNTHRYGVPNVSQISAVHEKKINNISKVFIFPSGSSYVVQGFEPKAISILLERGYTEEDMILKNRPSIKYFWGDDDGYGDGKWHVYHPDILVPKDNLVVEVKSTYTYNGNGRRLDWLSKNLAKRTGCEALGYNFEFIIL